MLKVWCVPVNFPHPGKEPEQAEAARNFIGNMKGLKGVSMGQNGIMLLTFTEKTDALTAKWQLEEFATVKLPIIEGTVTEDGKTLNCNRVLEGE